MSLWEFRAAVGGHRKAHASEDEAGLNTHDAAALSEWVDEKPVWH